MSKNKLTLNQRIENFVKYNWWAMSYLLVGTLFFEIYAYNNIMNAAKLNSDLLKKHISSVVLLTPDGRAVDVVRKAIDPDTDAFQLLIKRVMVDYLIVDYASATHGFEKKIVRTEDELYKNSEKLNFFAKNYLSHDKKPMSMFMSYMTHLLSAINRDELPEYITPYQSSVKSYKSSMDGTFEIEIEVKFQMIAFYIEEDKNQEKKGIALIKAKGRFDLLNATPNNPMGLKFEWLSIPKIEKRSDNNG